MHQRLLNDSIPFNEIDAEMVSTVQGLTQSLEEIERSHRESTESILFTDEGVITSIVQHRIELIESIRIRQNYIFSVAQEELSSVEDITPENLERFLIEIEQHRESAQLTHERQIKLQLFKLKLLPFIQ